MDAMTSELNVAQEWVAERFGSSADGAAAPISFVYGGRSSGELLGTWTREVETSELDDGRVRRTLTYTDPETKLVVGCELTEFRGHPAADWVVTLENTGDEDTPIIEDIEPLDVGMGRGENGDFIIHYALGDRNSAESFAPVETKLHHATALEITSIGGRSSDGHMPYFNVQGDDGGMVCAIGWSGQWAARFDRAANGTLQVQAGMEKTHLKLHPGEKIRTPRIVLVFWEGDAHLRGNRLLRKLLIDHYVPRRDGEVVYAPVSGTVTWADPDGNYERPHLRTIPELGELGLEVFWFDMNPQHWYGEFPTDVGTWEPHPVKFPNGWGPVGEAVKEAGMDFLVWYEPERVHAGTRIDKEHPEYVLRSAGEYSNLFALHDPEARAWLTDYIDVQVTAAQLMWIRWDFNIQPLGFWRRNDAPDRQGMTEIRYIEGLYAMWDEMMERHPGLVIDNCSSGGRRLDIETGMRSIPLWHSDMQCSGPNPVGEQLQNAGLYRWLPQHASAAFGLGSTYAFRSGMTTGGVFGGRANPQDDTEAFAGALATYTKTRPFLLGDFYPLFPHSSSERAWYGYQFHRSDLDAGMALLFRRAESPDASMGIALNAIDDSASYELRLEDSGTASVVSGADLTGLVVEIGSVPGSSLLFYEKTGK